jgi:AcrR family transcriptional regulator
VPSNRQAIPRAEREAEILACAIAEFTAHGFDDTTVAAVAERAGMTAANVHYYFDSKDELFAAVVAGSYVDLFAELDALDDPAERLRSYVRIHKATFAMRAAVQSVAGRSATMRRCLDERDAWLRNTVAQLVGDALSRELLVAVVIGLVEDTVPRNDPTAVLDAAITRLGG